MKSINNYFKIILFRFGFKRIYISKTAIFVCFCQILGLGLIALIQYYQGIWTFSFDNFMTNGELDASRVMDMIVFAPLREEVAFRGLKYLFLKYYFFRSIILYNL